MELELIPWRKSSAPTAQSLRTQLEAEGYDVFRWHDDAGADYQPHTHDHDESLWVIAGEITFGIGGTEYRLGPGDRLMLPAGTVHTARAGRNGATYLIGQCAS